MNLSSLNFGLPFFVRVILPGTAVAVALLGLVDPALQGALARLGLNSDAARIVGFTALVITVGFLLWFLSDPIYELYEGRRWPAWLSAPLVYRWERHINALLLRWRDLDQSTPRGRQENGEIWYELRQFPVDSDSGEPIALAPTKLGNLLAAYEQYPELRYGMDAVFYWPRLALVMDKDAREEIDRQWAPADGLLQLSAGLGAVGLLYLALGLLAFTFPVSLAGTCLTWARPEWTGLGLAMLAGAYIPYRLSWAFHVRNGERFKAAFDVLHPKLDAVRPMPPDEKEERMARWYELQYGEPRSPASPPPLTNAASTISRDAAAPAGSWRTRFAASLKASARAIIFLALLTAIASALLALGPWVDRAGSPERFGPSFAFVLALAILIGPALNKKAGIADPVVIGGRLHAPPAAGILRTFLTAAALILLAWYGGGDSSGTLSLAEAARRHLGVAVLEEMAGRVLLLGGALGVLRLALGTRVRRIQVSVALLFSAFVFASLHYFAGVDVATGATAVKYVGAALVLGWLYLEAGLFGAISAHWLANVFIAVSPVCT